MPEKMPENSSRNEFFCTECSFKTHQKRSLNRHKNFCHEKLKFYCSKCESVFYTKTGLQKHLSQDHIYFFYCNNCNFTTNTKKNLRQHTLLHKLKIICCPTCSFYTNLKSNLNRHVKSKHSPVKLYWCLWSFTTVCQLFTKYTFATLHISLLFEKFSAVRMGTLGTLFAF